MMKRLSTVARSGRAEPAHAGDPDVRRVPGTPGTGGPSRDRGVATVYACIGCVVLLLITGMAVQLGAGLLARQRAEIAADLAALGGAARVLDGPDAACQAAVAVASANGAVVQSCSVTGPDVLVIVSVRLPAGPLTGSATGRARAGPVSPVADAS